MNIAGFIVAGLATALLVLAVVIAPEVVSFRRKIKEARDHYYKITKGKS